MAKTNKILYSIKEQCTGKIPSDDTRLENRFILHQMNIARSLLAKEDYLTNGSLGEGYYQLKCCIPVVCDSIVCGEFASGDKIFYAQLKELMSGIGWSNISYFGNTEFSNYKMGLKNNWDRYTFKGFLGMEFQEYVGKRPAYTILGGYKDGDTVEDSNVALLKNLPTSGLKRVCVNGVWENPEDALCDEDDILTLEYPLPSTHVYKLELIVIKQILSTEAVPGDESNNTTDNTANVKKPNVEMSNPNDYNNG